MNYRLLRLYILTLTALASGCGSSNNNNGNNDPTLQGMLVSGGVAVASATITIYSSSEDNGGTELGSGTSDDDGMFQFSYRNPETADGVFYVTSSGGHLASQQDELSSAFVLASVIGAAPLPEQITINEVTTVASAFSLAQFIDGPTLNGNSVGLNMASRMLRNLANIETGESGATINNTANDPQSTYSALRTLNEMANLLVSCANDASVCQSILQLAVPLDGSPATDTFRALANMAKTPWRDPGPLFSLATADSYQPDLGTAEPSAWTLALKFQGNPTNLAGPGNMAFDAEGQMWILNNLVTSDTYILPDCASQELFRMDPATGDVVTFTGGGVLGAGYGITFAPQTNDVWLGNYGFKGSTCPIPIANNSVSQFTSDGTPLSPDAEHFDPATGVPQDGGWTNGGIGWAQGTVSNRLGDIWIASCNGEIVDGDQVDLTIYRNGDPNSWQDITDENLEKPFDIAFDGNNVAWVSGTSSDNIMAFAADGTKLTEYALGTSSKPMGVATDSQGNIWVSLSGEIDLPCPPPIAKPPSTYAGIAMVNLDGVQVNTRPEPPVSDYTAPGGLTIAWGIAVDGADNVWVANFTAGGVSNFCGANTASCPAGVTTGEALSPDGTGYHSDLLERKTAVEIDSSGNVWLTNNWKDLPIKPDPVGDGMVVYIGLAAPVKAPLIGPPEQPQ